jgi:hypothetical protein
MTTRTSSAHAPRRHGRTNASSGRGLAHLLVRGEYAFAHEVSIRQRIMRLATRVRFLPPLHRPRPGAPDPEVFAVETTEPIVLRLAAELKQVFGGRTSIGADREGRLVAIWSPAPAEG